LSEVVVVVAVVLIERLDVAALPFGVTLAGDSLHEDKLGKPVQAKVTD